MSKHEKRILLVTGAAGFVGQAVLKELAGADAVLRFDSIRTFDHHPPQTQMYPDENGASQTIHVESLVGDIRDRQAVVNACEGVTAVLHLASMVDWGTHPSELVREVNVEGTRNVLDGCSAHGVSAMVYTSSIDAIFAGKPIVDADETYPYPLAFANVYSQSKAEAEQLVQHAAGDSLRTVVLRPSGIFGENDPYHLGHLIKMAKQGPFVKVGNRKIKCMHIYVGNVAHGHLLAVKALLEGNTRPNGEIYFLTDHEPENFFDTLCPIMEAAGISWWPKDLWIPGAALLPAAVAAEAISFVLRPVVHWHPGLSRFALRYLCNDFTLRGTRATADFGYQPKYLRTEAVSRTAQWLKQQSIAK